MSQRFFQDRAIERQLLRMSLLSTGAALLLAAIAFMAYDALTFEQGLISRLTAFADIVGINSASAILFNDAQSANTTLSALKSRPGLIATALYSSKGDLFAHWSRTPDGFVFPTVPTNNHDTRHFRWRYAEVFHPIVIDRARVGTVYLGSDLSERDRRFELYLVIVLVVMAFSFVLATLIALRLGRQISKPILDLVEVAERVSQDKEYSLRASTSGGGEIGLLVQTFNDMLTQIQQRGEALQAAHDELEKKVLERTDELRQKEEELYQSRRLESVGRLAGGVAHDFNNLLTGIIGCSETLEQELPPDSELAVEVQEIKRAGERATALTRQLLAFGRKQIISPQRLELNTLVQTTGKLLQRLIGEDVHLTFELGVNLGSIHADPGQMDQILVNLAVNARDAMPNGGDVLIRTSNVHLDAESDSLDLPTGDYVMLSIGDTGTGMTPAVKAQIFEPFFTTKELGKGTGLGLATVYGIVKQNHGGIQVYSHPGMGTIFKIFFPRDKNDLARDKTPVALPEQGIVAGGHEVILLVEDDRLVSGHIVRLLRRKGYEVLSASSGAEGLAALRKQQRPVDLVLTDVIMPEMNGRQMVDQLRQSWPTLRVLYMSGYPAEVIAKHGVVEAGISFIEKPFHSDQICEKIREILDTPA